MNDDERLHQLVRAALPPVAASRPSRDLWPAVVARTQEPVRFSSADLVVAALIAIVLLAFPKWIWLLAFHL